MRHLNLPCIPGGAGLLDLALVLIFWLFCLSFNLVVCTCSSSLADSVAESIKRLHQYHIILLFELKNHIEGCRLEILIEKSTHQDS